VWRNSFWESITAKDVPIFITQLEIFTVVALLYCFVAGMSVYIARLTALKWTNSLVDESYKLFGVSQVKNLNQRIEQDCMEYPDLFIQLFFGVIKSFGYILVFSFAIYYNFSIQYVLILLVYAILASVVTKYVAKPLIKMNYEQQGAAATFRNQIIKQNFIELFQITLGIARRSKYLSYTQTFFGQLSVVLPIIIIAPAYFTTGMTFGSLMQLQGSCNTLLDNLLMPMNSFAQINRLLSCRKRLKEVNIL